MPLRQAAWQVVVINAQRVEEVVGPPVDVAIVQDLEPPAAAIHDTSRTTRY